MCNLFWHVKLIIFKVFATRINWHFLISNHDTCFARLTSDRNLARTIGSGTASTSSGRASSLSKSKNSGAPSCAARAPTPPSISRAGQMQSHKWVRRSAPSASSHGGAAIAWQGALSSGSMHSSCETICPAWTACSVDWTTTRQGALHTWTRRGARCSIAAAHRPSGIPGSILFDGAGSLAT